jgi:hypothetical protein
MSGTVTDTVTKEADLRSVTTTIRAPALQDPENIQMNDTIEDHGHMTMSLSASVDFTTMSQDMPQCETPGRTTNAGWSSKKSESGILCGSHHRHADLALF